MGWLGLVVCVGWGGVGVSGHDCHLIVCVGWGGWLVYWGKVGLELGGDVTMVK